MQKIGVMRMETKKPTDLDQMHEKAKIELLTMGDDTAQNKETVNAVLDELNVLYTNFKEWMKVNLDSEVMEPRLQKLKDDTELLLAKAKLKVQTYTEKPEVQTRLIEGKEFVVDTSNKVAHVVSEGAQELLQNEQIRKVVDSVSITVQSIKHDERIKEGVISLKKGTLKVAESAYQGLKKMLDETTDDEQ